MSTLQGRTACLLPPSPRSIRWGRGKLKKPDIAKKGTFMKRWALTLFAVGFLLQLVSGLEFTWAEAEKPGAFETAMAYMEQNVTDKDLEVVFSISGGDEGLTHLQVVGPNGRTVIQFDAPDASPLGIRKFKLESPEPSDDQDKVKAAYPAGSYVISGKLLNGASLRSTASLSHDMPPAAAVVHPADGVENVVVEGLQVTWKGLQGISLYIVEVEQEELGVNITAKLPALATAFQVPAGFLQAGMEYKLSIGTVTSEGNASFTESSFTTAK